MCRPNCDECLAMCQCAQRQAVDRNAPDDENVHVQVVGTV